jgi:flavin reductase (DIM6/NTAB) family NADH-FMN oxidoreductase RutF
MLYAAAERDHMKLLATRSRRSSRRVRSDGSRPARSTGESAPYSFFNDFSSVPPIVGFSSGGWKDSASFAKESGEFVANLATNDLKGPMNETSAAFVRGDNEFARTGLTMAECRLVAAPRVAESPAALECRLV